MRQNQGRRTRILPLKGGYGIRDPALEGPLMPRHPRSPYCRTMTGDTMETGCSSVGGGTFLESSPALKRWAAPGTGEPRVGFPATLLCSVCSLWASGMAVTPSQSICTTSIQECCGCWGKTEQCSLPAQPCLVICPLHCRGSSGNTAAVPDGTFKKSQLRGPQTPTCPLPPTTLESGEELPFLFFSHPKEINMLCKNNSIQQSSTLHLPPSGLSLLASH